MIPNKKTKEKMWIPDLTPVSRSLSGVLSIDGWSRFLKVFHKTNLTPNGHPLFYFYEDIGRNQFNKRKSLHNSFIYDNKERNTQSYTLLLSDTILKTLKVEGSRSTLYKFSFSEENVGLYSNPFPISINFLSLPLI